jgi:hypothetical protein
VLAVPWVQEGYESLQAGLLEAAADGEDAKVADEEHAGEERRKQERLAQAMLGPLVVPKSDTHVLCLPFPSLAFSFWDNNLLCLPPPPPASLSPPPVAAADAFLPHLSRQQRFMLGAGIALLAGLLYGTSFDPSQRIIDHSGDYMDPVAASTDTMDYVFSHFNGILLTSVLYVLSSPTTQIRSSCPLKSVPPTHAQMHSSCF